MMHPSDLQLSRVELEIIVAWVKNPDLTQQKLGTQFGVNWAVVSRLQSKYLKFDKEQKALIKNLTLNQ